MKHRRNITRFEVGKRYGTRGDRWWSHAYITVISRSETAIKFKYSLYDGMPCVFGSRIRYCNDCEFIQPDHFRHAPWFLADAPIDDEKDGEKA